MRINNCINFGIRHIYNRKLLFLLSVVMIGVSIVLLFDVLGIYFACNEQVMNGRAMFKHDREHIYKINLDVMIDDLTYFERLDNCIAELDSQLCLGLYDYTNMEISGLNEDDLQEILEDIQEEGWFPKSEDIYGFNITNTMLEMCDVKDENGNTVQLGKQGTYVEVAVGKKFADLLPIGSVFQDELSGQSYIVTCILEEGQMWRGGELYYVNDFLTLDSYIILPFEIENREWYFSGNCIGNIYYWDKEGSATEDLSQIKKVAQDYEVLLDVQSFYEYENAYVEENRLSGMLSNLLSVLLLIANFMAIGIITISVWLLDSHDIGVLCANGFQFMDIMKIIIVENMIRFLIPAGIAYFLIYHLGLTEGYREAVCYQTFAIIYMLFFAGVIVISMLCYLFIRRQMPNYLLKGEIV